ncbi:MAG: hypothetical protein H6604_09700 [Flavobacteriales bacterium]|nr:hypothetical protein [Flavobacteriales bacterium]
MNKKITPIKLHSAKFYFTLFLVAFYSLCFSQKISTSVDTLQIKIGEPIKYTLKIHDKDIQNPIPYIKKELQDKNITLNSYLLDSINKPKTYILNLTSFETGNQVIPAFAIPYKNDSLHTTSYKIRVQDIVVDENKPFEDIKNIEEVPLSFFDYLSKYSVYLVGSLIFIAFGLLIYFVIKNLKKASKSKTELSLYEKTILQINQLKQKKYIDDHKFRLFYIELSKIIREYTEERYQIPAKILLTNDLFDFINRKNILSKEDIESLKEIFLVSDSVKFAKFNPTAQTAEQHIKQTLHFVESSKQSKEIEELSEQTQENVDVKIRKI